jgi:hypothetical protein
MKYIVVLDPLKQIIVPGQWPHSVIGEGRKVIAPTKEQAIDSVAHDTGVSRWMLKVKRGGFAFSPQCRIFRG